MKTANRRWNRVLVTITATALFTAYADAQNRAPAATPHSDHRFQGYLFISPGTYVGYSESRATIHVGGGAEALLYGGIGMGTEVGVLGAIGGSDILGLLSIDGSYHFSRRQKVSPFLTGGYSLVGGNGRRNLVNYGGGVNWWFRENRGIRLEFRDHIYADGSRRHLLSYRLGFTFRCPG